MSFLITILASKTNVYGIAKDVEILTKVLQQSGVTVRHCDPLEAPSYTDLAIHVEIPILGWAAWAATNILVVNPEWFVEQAWKPYLERFDQIIVKDSVAESWMVRLGYADKVKKILWSAAPMGVPPTIVPKDDFLWVLGASKNKRAYVPILLQAWKPTYPKLYITTVEPIDLSGVELPPNVLVHMGDLTVEQRAKMALECRGHICCSRAEGFGYTAAEAAAANAFVILNSLPVYVDTYRYSTSTVFLPSKLEREFFDVGAPLDVLQDSLDRAMDAFRDSSGGSKAGQAAIEERWGTFKGKWKDIVKPLLSRIRPVPLKYLPPRLDIESCPPISVITLVYNRKKFFELACHNMLVTDYPKDKIEWIVVDDSDDPAEQNSDRIVAVGNAADPVKFVYVPLRKKTPVSEKRNQGVAKASNSIVLFMDDDDHYPETSFRRRVAWLTLHPWNPRAVAATTIACYDLVKGISAVNVPPLDLPVSQRISEATLTFYRDFWEAKKFPQGVVVGEGAEFIEGRESEFLEIPPQQIIVAFSHGKNVSSRRVPSDPDTPPSCFWGFPKEFLQFVHGLAGITVSTATE